MEIQTKKSAVDLTELALGILVLGIVVSIGAVILVSMRDSTLSNLATYTTTNESLTFTANKAILANKGTGTVTISNQTTGATVTSTNYTTSVATDGTVTVTNLTSVYQPWYATYTTYNVSRGDYSLPNNASIGLGEYGNWFKIIVIVGVAAVVLSIIFMSFGRKSADIGGSY